MSVHCYLLHKISLVIFQLFFPFLSFLVGLYIDSSALYIELSNNINGLSSSFIIIDGLSSYSSLFFSYSSIEFFLNICFIFLFFFFSFGFRTISSYSCICIAIVILNGSLTSLLPYSSSILLLNKLSLLIIEL